MMFNVTVETPNYQAVADTLVRNLVDASFKAADASGKVYEDAYKAAVPVYNPPGTFKSASGTRQHFLNLVNAISRRTLLFQDRTGAYSVVGVKAAPNNWRSIAPQGLWIEYGTDDRETKDGRPTGFVPAYGILRQISEQFSTPASNTFNAVMKREIEK